MMVFVFFFKQKTAYEMRISDWSSDVCSSDLSIHPGNGPCPASWRTPGARPVEPRSQHGLRSDAVAGSGGGGVGAVCQPDPFVAGLALVLERPGHRLGAWDQRAEVRVGILAPDNPRSEEHTSELQSLMRISYAVFCLKKKKK